MFEKIAKEYEEYIISLRREIHKNPELSYEEIGTSQLVCNELERMKIPYERLDENCVVGILEGNISGKSIAIRADMDALPIIEENQKEYSSLRKGVMHACGHDGHTAMLLGVAAILKNHRDKFRGKIYFCFQSAEEVWGGAGVILDYLENKGGVDEAIASHLWAEIEAGYIAIDKGAVMAQTDGFEIEVVGKGGHASRPDHCIDPIKAASNIVLGITSIPVNRYRPMEPLVIHVGALNAGSVGNVIPQKATILGGIRSFSQQGKDTAWELIPQIAENCARMYGATAKVTLSSGVPAVVNQPEAVERAWLVNNRENIFKRISYEPIMASENFGAYLKKYNGFMAYIGVKNVEKGIEYPHHHPRFDIDETVLKDGAWFLAEYAIEFLK